MRKKFIFSIFLFGFCFLPFLSKAATLSLSPFSGNYKVGETFKVFVILDTEGVETDGVDIYYLNFPPSLLQVEKVEPGNLYSETVTNSVDNLNGKIDFSQVSSGGTTFKGSGTLAIITFKVLAEGTANVYFDFTPGDTKDCNVSSQGIDVLSKVENANYNLGSLSSGIAITFPQLDTTPPSIEEIEVSVKDTKATISWKTSEPSISWIVYGTTTDYDKEEKVLSFATSHSITLKNLSPSTTYHYQIRSKDKAGNIGYFTDKTFTTKSSSISDQQLELEEIKAKFRNLLIQIIQVLEAIILHLEKELKARS